MNPWRRLTEIRFPDDLPVVCGFLTAVLVSATLLAPVIAESALGRPSSTAGIGYFVVPMLGLLSGAAAFLVARGLRGIARRAGSRTVHVPPWLAAAGLLATAVTVAALAFNAGAQVIATEAARRPRVIIDSTHFVRTAPSPGEGPRIDAPLLFSVYQDAVVSSIDWNGRAVSFSGTDEHVTIRDKAGVPVASTDLQAFDYIATIRAVPVCSSSGGANLAVLVTLRATSHRSMLILYDPNGAVVYQEHLERTRSADGSTGSMSMQHRGDHDILLVDHGSVSAWTCPAG